MVKITSFIRRSLTLWFALIAWIGGSLSGAACAYRLASLVAPSAKTVHRNTLRKEGVPDGFCNSL